MGSDVQSPFNLFTIGDDAHGLPAAGLKPSTFRSLVLHASSYAHTFTIPVYPFQIQGIGTALKILFSGDNTGPLSSLQGKGISEKFQLRRTEIVSLINAFSR